MTTSTVAMISEFGAPHVHLVPSPIGVTPFKPRGAFERISALSTDLSWGFEYPNHAQRTYLAHHEGFPKSFCQAVWNLNTTKMASQIECDLRILREAAL